MPVDEVRVDRLEGANQKNQSNRNLQPDLKGIMLPLIFEVGLIFQVDQTPGTLCQPQTPTFQMLFTG